MIVAAVGSRIDHGLQEALWRGHELSMAERPLKRIAVFNPGFHVRGVYHRRAWPETPLAGGWHPGRKS